MRDACFGVEVWLVVVRPVPPKTKDLGERGGVGWLFCEFISVTGTANDLRADLWPGLSGGVTSVAISDLFMTFFLEGNDLLFAGRFSCS